MLLLQEYRRQNVQTNDGNSNNNNYKTYTGGGGGDDEDEDIVTENAEPVHRCPHPCSHRMCGMNSFEERKLRFTARRKHT